MRTTSPWLILYLLTVCIGGAAGCSDAVSPDDEKNENVDNAASEKKPAATTAEKSAKSVRCPGKKVSCTDGELCQEDALGKVVGCTDDCAPESVCEAVCCAPGATCDDDGKCQAADLTITQVAFQGPGFSPVEVSEQGCEIQDGCYGDAGKRTVIPFELTIQNSGSAPLEVGAPWDSPAYYLSACASEYLTANFIQAEVLSPDGEVVAARHLPTSCIADDESDTYRCSSQGLAADDLSQQPGHSCNSLDVTGLPAGQYTVRFTINADERFAESNFDNNTIEIVLDKPACDQTLCGTVCCPDGTPCVDGVCRLPDLRTNEDAIVKSMVIGKQMFGENSCEIAEACITGPGKRRLLKFEGRIENVGTGPLNPGPEEDNPLYEFSECHGHHHFLDFTDYRLLTLDGATASQGHKQSFCLVSMDPVEDYEGPSPGVHPEPGETGCSYLEAGWADIYGVGTPCQWVDITDVEPGDYLLQVAVNPLGKVAETSVANNVVQVPVTIPADAPCQEEEVCGDVVDQDCDGQSDAGDWDCWNSAFCCGDEDVCGLEHNWSCDCGGLPEWEAHDCGYYGTGGAGNGGGGSSDDPCCNAEDSCGWANDGICDCNYEYSWDEPDCEYDCCEPWDPCGLAYNGYCECSEAWDEYDCSFGYGGAGNGTGGMFPAGGSFGAGGTFMGSCGGFVGPGSGGAFGGP
jgi:hypothetical protein